MATECAQLSMGCAVGQAATLSSMHVVHTSCIQAWLGRTCYLYEIGNSTQDEADKEGGCERPVQGVMVEGIKYGEKYAEEHGEKGKEGGDYSPRPLSACMPASHEAVSLCSFILMLLIIQA